MHRAAQKPPSKIYPVSIALNVIMNPEMVLLPDTRNFTLLWWFFGLLALMMPAVGIYTGDFVALMFEQGAIWMSLFFLVPPAIIHFWGKAQNLNLGTTEIIQNSLEQFRFKRKIFKVSEIEWYRYERGVLVIKSKQGPYPKFPYGPFADLNGVILVPPLFLKDFGKIEAYLNNRGIYAC